jgi:hypothetical protein
MKFNFVLISNEEKELLSQIESFHKNENVLWKIPNLIIPIGTIVLSLLCFLAFSSSRLEFLRYLNLIVNGSLPLIAINQISSTGSYIFKFDKQVELRLEQNTYLLRIKLFLFSVVSLILGVLIFAYQVINNPFSSWIILLVMIIISSCLIAFSSYVSRRVYLLQDTFIEETFDSEVRQEANAIHGQNW